MKSRVVADGPKKVSCRRGSQLSSGKIQSTWTRDPQMASKSSCCFLTLEGTVDYAEFRSVFPRKAHGISSGRCLRFSGTATFAAPRLPESGLFVPGEESRVRFLAEGRTSRTSFAKPYNWPGPRYNIMTMTR